MKKWKPKDITAFQKLHLKHYGLKISAEEANTKITALVGLISLAIDIEKSKTSQDSKTNNANGNLSEPKES